MLRSARFLLPLVAALALVPASGASAAKATFTGTFTAERAVEWDQPRGVSVIACDGENWFRASGGETASVRTRPFKVTVESFGTLVHWSFGKQTITTDPRDNGIPAKGQHKRWYEPHSGTTGGWCGGGSEHPRRPTDCGTQLPEFLLTFSAFKGRFSWATNPAPWMSREKLGFYQCPLNTPEGMHETLYPSLEAKYRQSDLFNRRKQTITIAASKTYGPTVVGVPNLGVNNTRTGTYSYKLTLTRKAR
jgi:hypothetical protein